LEELKNEKWIKELDK